MAEDSRILQLVYTFFLGLLLALFVGVGINTFYEAPERSEYPRDAYSYGVEPTDEQRAIEREYEEKSDAHELNEERPYNRNVSMIVITAAVALLAISIVYDEKLKMLSDGVMLGGLFTLMYGIGRGFASANSEYVFVIISISLASVLYLGYRRFLDKQPAKK